MGPASDKKQPDDSLQYYPPTPAVMDKETFREYYRRISAFFDSTLLKGPFSGQILLAKEGTVLYEKYAGFKDVRKKDSMDAATSLHIASASKTFTGIAILRLVQEGKLQLDDSISRYFPLLPYKGITVKMLLNHRSGLPNYVHFMDKTGWDTKQYCSNLDVLDILIKQRPNPEAAPGRKFSYCNTNYILLALLIEQLSGQSYPVYMREKLFGPLQMKDTYVFTRADSSRATPSFGPSGNFWQFDFLDLTYGDKNIYSTARDLLRWDQALYSGQLLSPALLDAAFTPYSFERPSMHNYGLGFRLMQLPNGKKIIYHFGRWHGNNACFARLPDEKAVIIILGNRFNRGIYYAAHRAYDLFGDYFQSAASEEESDSLPAENKEKESPAKKTTQKKAR